MSQRTNELMHKRANSGLTLVELLITIAISAIIVTITFTGLRTEQQRTAAKDATDRLQTELVGLQNKMQSSLALGTNYCTRGGGNYGAQGKMCSGDGECLVPAGSAGSGQGRCVSGPPGGYGLSIVPAATTYTMFADMPYGLTPPNGIYETGATYDQLISGGKSLGQNIRVAQVYANGASLAATERLDVSFSGANGQILINRLVSATRNQSGCGTACTSAKIVLQHAVTGVCYAITIDKASQIVGKRQFSSNCQ